MLKAILRGPRFMLRLISGTLDKPSYQRQVSI